MSSDVRQVLTQEAWQQALEHGRVHDALRLYLGGEQQDAATRDLLETLTDLRAHLRAKRWKKALQVAEAHVSERPGSPRHEIDWQALQAQIRQLDESSQVLDRRDAEGALTILAEVRHPVLQAEVETQRGTAFIFMNELTQASACFERALTFDPKHYRAMTNQGNLALEAGQVDAAITAYEQALKINEEFSNALHNLGVAYRKKGDIGRSVASIRKAQRALRQEDSERAKGALSRSTRGLQGKSLRWLLYGAILVVVYVWLQGQGIL
jgi:tetratricopeptide (TPR) repeat protein